MKRSAIILLTAIYLLSCVGIGINRFYCCGKLAWVKLTYASAENNDAGKQTTGKNKCCKHETQSFKIKDNHMAGDCFAAHHPLPVIIPSIIAPAYSNAALLLHCNTLYKGNAPPIHPDISVYTLNCTYRI